MTALPIFAIRRSAVFTHLETSPEGLPRAEAERRLELYGRNSLADSPKVPAWRKWLTFVDHPMALVLWLAGGITLLTDHTTLGLLIWLVVLINASFSFWREHRAELAVDSLKHLLPSYARVIRDGQEIKIPADQLVPGDLLVLAEGDHIPADARLVEEYGLRTNNSTLTGESMPARKTAEASMREGLAEVERPNLVFAGTSVVSGTARAVVFATGMLTQFGRIANLTQTVKDTPGGLQHEMIRLTRTISIAALAIGVIVFMVGSFDVGMPISDSFLLAIGIIVAAVPEGLVPTVTLSLAIAVQRLAQSGVLVKKLSMVETLGTVSVICTDKSGTLTQNQMTIHEIWVAGHRLKVSGDGYEPSGRFSPSPETIGHSHPAFPEDLHQFLSAALLCNNSRLNAPTEELPRWSCLGDQTEAALKVLSRKGGLDEIETSRQFPRLHELPFDPHRKRMATVHRCPSGEFAIVKGAPKEVLQLCTSYWANGEAIPLSPQIRSQILETNDQFARSALRVLALARRDLPARRGAYSIEGVESGLTFLGLAGMMDPPRPDVAEAVQSFRTAGIRVVMITGDYGLTAESIARRLGMLASPNPRILTGAELDDMEDDELQSLLPEELIFARMAPEHKLRLVATFQNSGEVVAVIGDGVNDAPALRKADVGIAMGITGTDVAREAADIILTRDNFRSVIKAIEEGRAVYANLRKFITYIFASNLPEIVPFLLTAIFHIPLALSVAQILAIDLGTDIFPALALGMEKPEPDIMQRPPRRRNQSLIDSSLIYRAYLWLGSLETILCFLGFFLVYEGLFPPTPSSAPYLFLPAFRNLGMVPASQSFQLASTVFFAVVVLAQIGNAFACRSETSNVRKLGLFSNPFLWGGIAIELILTAALIYVPFLASLFGHLPLPIYFWPGLFLFAPLIYGAERSRKLMVQWWAAHRPSISKFFDHLAGRHPGKRAAKPAN